MRLLCVGLAAVLAFGYLSAAGAETASFDSCRATWDGNRLVLSNRFVAREWQWKNGQLYATSFRDLESGAEWLDPKQAAASPIPKNAAKPVPGAMKFASRSGAMTPVQAPSLVVELTSPAAVTYRFQVFPEARGILMQTVEPAFTGGEKRTAAAPARAQAPTGNETSEPAAKTARLPSDILDSLILNAEHIRLTQVTLLDQTDAHNQLVLENEWLPQRNERELHLEGNLFIAARRSGCGRSSTKSSRPR